MIDPGAVLTALTHKQGRGHDVTSEGRVVGTVIFVVIGAVSLLVCRVGWRHAGSIVPTGLPEDLYWKRYRVLRRGAVTFGVIGVLFLVLALWAVTSG